MAFCNSCGTSLEPNAKFCPKCGSTVPVTTKVPVASSANLPPTPAPGSTNALKIVLIVVGAIVVLGIVLSAATALFFTRIARHTRVEENNGKVTVHSPFGTVESNTNPEEVARDLGIEVYPGARPLKEGASNVRIGNMHTVTAQFETDDPPEKVADFYKSRISNLNVNVSDDKHYTLVATQKDSIVTINIEPQEGKTLIHIANVAGKGVAGHESSD